MISHSMDHEKDRFHYTKNVKFDFIAAIVLFLVAIPLCLGIALASGAPLFSGIISGVIGGLVVGCLSGSQISVSGPAAGMAAIVITATSQLGDFNSFLLALSLAGILQILIGGLKAGFIADYVPSNVVQGLLCAIGILLIIKQLPFALSLSSTLSELDTHLLETTEGVTLGPLLTLSQHIDKGAVLITAISFTILIYFEKTRYQLLKNIPAPIIVVITGIIINEYFKLTNSSLVQMHPNLVNIPIHNNFNEFANQLRYPNWQAWKNPNVYLYALIIAVVASLETLLNIKAAEKIDLLRRHCSKNQELLAQGCGNIISGLLGGIPVTSVILRTSVNIQAGAKTKLATILHGILILLAVIMIPEGLNLIPLASLASILIMTGYKLTTPYIYKTIYQQGIDRFIPFIATVLTIIFFDMLTGILVGLIISLFYILKSNSQVRIDIIKEYHPTGIINRIALPQQITFLNKASLFAELDTIPHGAKLIIDARHTNYIDKEIIELIKEFRDDESKLRNISLNLIGFKDHYDVHDHINFINVTTFDIQTNLTAKQVLTILKEGNKRFYTDTRIHRSTQIDIQGTAEAQHPLAIVLACIDSRVPVETVFDMNFGDLFCVRVAGNVVNPDILASIEYACHIVGAKLIVVMGHTRCGAIQAACDQVHFGHITQLLQKIKPAILAEKTIEKDRNSQNKAFVEQVTELNVAATLSHLYKDSTILQDLINNNTISMVGAIYDVTTGKVNFKDFSEKLPLLHDSNELLIEKLNNLNKSSNFSV